MINLSRGYALRRYLGVWWGGFTAPPNLYSLAHIKEKSLANWQGMRELD
jgi:hypothetical protein